MDKKPNLCPHCNRTSGHVSAVPGEDGPLGFVYTCREGHRWGDEAALAAYKKRKGTDQSVSVPANIVETEIETPVETPEFLPGGGDDEQ